ncbi:MAG: hypothetical protein IJ274_15475, partial [Lachnospiraceae bacterium]|nr:hypothetical protein [Lachnospiraceae bacterium]
MKKNMVNGMNSFECILPDYGRRRLITCADSIRELADTFQEKEKEQPEAEKTEDRNEYIWQKKLSENKSLMAGHLKEMAQIMKQVAEESRRCEPMSERRFRQIAYALKEVGIQIKNLYLIENETGRMEVSLTMRNVKENHLSAEEIGDLLSVLLNMHLVSAQDNAFFVGGDWQT